MSVDLLIFGPHPDDIEIGLSAAIATHADANYAVGLCDLTRAELSSNSTPDERHHEADAAAQVLGAAQRENLGWPDNSIAHTPELIRSAVELIRQHQPRALAIPY